MKKFALGALIAVAAIPAGIAGVVLFGGLFVRDCIKGCD